MSKGNHHNKANLIGMSACPKCRENNRDKKGNNLGSYDDGHFYCFACGYYKWDSKESTGEDMNESVALKPSVPLIYNPNETESTRGISPKYFDIYSVQSSDGKHVYPIFSKTDFKTLTGLQTRYLAGKKFSTAGETINEALFGANVFPPGYSSDIIITEGCLDAISAHQMLSGRTACVAVLNSTSAKKMCQNNFDYLNSFKTIYLALDNDKAGKDATKAVAPLFQGKCKVINFPEKYKDSNDVLMGGDAALFNRLYSAAPMWVPDGIVRSDSTLDRLLSYRDKLKIAVPYPYAGLNDMLRGIRGGELVTICAGSGSGKSQVMKELIYWLLVNSTEDIGALFLEESLEKTELNLLGIHMNKPLHLPETPYDEKDFRKAYQDILSSGRIFHHDHFGSTEIDNIISKVRYMAKVANCKYVFLDHISIVVSSQENGDERKAIDEVVTKLRTLVEETDICVFMVTHLKRVDGAHEEGEPVSLNHLRGSAGIAQLSDAVISIERNQQHDDKDKRNLSLIRVLKARFTGQTGPAAAVKFDPKTYRLTEVPIEEYLHMDKKGADGKFAPIEQTEESL